MSYLIGVAGLLGLGAVYVGLGLADRGREGCGGCAPREPDTACGACSTNRSVAGNGEPTADRGESPGGHETAPWETEGDEWKTGREPRQPEGGWSR